MRHAAPATLLTAVAGTADGDALVPGFYASTAVGSNYESADGAPRPVAQEAYLGCLWNFAVNFSACQYGGQHEDGLQRHGNFYGTARSRKAANSLEEQEATDTQCFTIIVQAHELQERFWRYYSSLEVSAPPLEEATWIVGMEPRVQLDNFGTCPGFILLPMLLIAEARFSLASKDVLGLSYLQRARALMHPLASAANGSFARDHYEAALAAWPVSQAFARARRAHARSMSLASAPPPASLDMVIAHCSGDLRWLKLLRLPERLRVLVYLKCTDKADGLPDFCDDWTCVEAKHLDAGSNESTAACSGSDECGAYLYHIRSNFETLADWTVFLQENPQSHMHLSYLTLVLKFLAAGPLWTEPFFLQFNNDRHLMYWTPCLQAAAEGLGLQTAGSSRKVRVSTYCCSQFLVHKKLITGRGREFFERADDLMRIQRWRHIPSCSYTSRETSSKEGSGRAFGLRCDAPMFHSRPCYVLEWLWHVMFGAPPLLPRRENDITLPPLLRFDLGPSTTMPLPDFSAFLRSHTPW
eukprot:TRINITY_DN18199_c0_g1_i3.p1 TRINITY_DN18199_c0_g1~~TRINITY_DN18199_c0_g1_i3.p1  ORF type:complete len:526 (-),score=94.02 TRINITY_DN18199_c0_g1_i3:578-2155(-)